MESGAGGGNAGLEPGGRPGAGSPAPLPRHPGLQRIPRHPKDSTGRRGGEPAGGLKSGEGDISNIASVAYAGFNINTDGEI